MNIKSTISDIMQNFSFRTALPALFAAFAIPAAAQASAAPEDSTQTQQRIFMGETVNVPINEDAYKLENPSWWSRVRATGSIQAEFMVPMKDEAIGTKDYDSDVLNNTYFDFTINAPYVSAGARFQFTKWPMPGYADEFKGWGVPYFWVTGKYKWMQITAGDFYEQFGSGLILRTYQERSLGVDGALRGGRIKLNPANGLYFTALVGQERYFWHHNPDLVWGADAEWSLNESFSNAFTPSYGLTLGVSYVGKNDRFHNPPDELDFVKIGDYKINFPNVVAAFDGRVKARLKDFNILAEFATKNNDPNALNRYIFKRGHAELLSLSYAANGFSSFIQAKRSENMSYLSDQLQTGATGNGFINHMPAFTNTQTYTLATIYPYSTNLYGEWAFQAEVGYLFKRNTPLGGKYGTKVKLSASYISSLAGNAPLGNGIYTATTATELDALKKQLAGSDGIGSPYWKIGGLLYSDLNFEVQKKVTKNLQFTFFYLLQKLDYDKIFGNHNIGMVTANTFILEGQWKMAKRAQLRWELQYLTTKQDQGDWMAALVEVSFAPHWMITLSDTYNNGNTHGDKLNYYSAMVTYNVKANRFSLAFGRNREGYNCSGGVCRWVPATKGFTLTYNYTF